MRKLALLPLVLWLLLPAPAFAAQPYSAECVLNSGGTQMINHIFVGGQDRWRVETGGQPQVTIVRLDRKVMYTLLPASKSYYEMPMSNEDATPAFKPETPQGKVSRKLLGSERVGTHPAKKYEVTTAAPGGKSRVTYEWLSEELGVPIKMVAADKSWSLEYRDIKIGPQDPKLFEVPAGFTKLSIPSLPRMPGAKVGR